MRRSLFRARRNLSGSSVLSCSDPLGLLCPNHLCGGPGTDPSGPDRSTLRATLLDRLARSFLASQVLNILPRSTGKTSASHDLQGFRESSLRGVSRTHQGLLCKRGRMSVAGTGSCCNRQAGTSEPRERAPSAHRRWSAMSMPLSFEKPSGSVSHIKRPACSVRCES
jgi:hypothetical protein